MVTSAVSPALAPMREAEIGRYDVELFDRPDGSVCVNSRVPLGEAPLRLSDRLEYWARETPERVFLAERDAGGEWIALKYGDALPLVRRVAAGILSCNVSPERPIAILSGNSIDHAVIGLAAYFAGVPYAPISPGYSTIRGGMSKLAPILEILTPGLVFAADGAILGEDIRALIPGDATLVVSHSPPADPRAMLYRELAAASDSGAVTRAHDAAGPDTIAKILFTSGSTGVPKGVIQTHQMLATNQMMVRSVFRFFETNPPVVVDWLPWHHTAGGNNNFGMILFNGGSLYIDDGKPVPGQIEKTVRNLREVPATVNYGVPKGWAELIPYLRADRKLRETFFSELQLMFYAGASLPQHVWDALNELSVQACGQRVAIMTGLGSTETGPFALCCTKDVTRAGIVGLPAPGVKLKLVPAFGKLEARVKSPSITPGYWRQAELTRKAFDAEGYYCFGDALAFVDRADVYKGFVFDGRVGEDFKLLSGTWVSAGTLRPQLLSHFAPLCADAVIAGENRDEVGALVFPDLERCRELIRAAGGAVASDAPAEEVVADPRLWLHFARRLADFAARATGSSNRVTRLLLLAEPPSFGNSEITDKGSINAGNVLRRRRACVEMLYADPPAGAVIVAE